MSRRIIIQGGIVRLSGALFDKGAWQQFAFAPVDDALATVIPIAGQRYVGRLRRVDRPLNAAFVDIGGEQDGFLPLSKISEQLPTEGGLFIVECRAEPRGEKGATLSFVTKAEPERAIGPIDSPPTPMAQILTALGAIEGDDIQVDKSALLNAVHLHAATLKVSCRNEGNLFEVYGADEALTRALAHRVSLVSGGILTIDEAEAMTVIDVDTASANGASAKALREKTIREAVEEIATQLTARNLGGQIIIDLPRFKAPEDFDALKAFVTATLSAVNGVDSVNLQRNGLCILRRRRLGRSLLDIACESTRSDPIPGRIWRLEWRSAALFEALEVRLRKQPSIRLTARCGNALFDFVDKNPQWRERLFESCGAHAMINRVVTMAPRDFDIHEEVS